ncbi:TetR/AcrR family transcriptional regulator [Chitinophaga nivalis]|uniref:TetR/AcrR family transcriptional regulator n=1 Tax=Chitinophaga nivalis TaxID=2991709 RepID=A0ABT3IRZ8_9BACT|nr:TetR/AcrR family transcriptional regulator [Chitinophaga nivalis]MCW3463790.1 TetR/AcrR family transcriptional regulator [Chitinophaga nivalis]MCW3486520.1 TetR/AcrR family transcriptional regulator [Chitinophaga nivalis]
MGKAERTRQFIIETAAPIFNTKGIAGTAISDILSATKLAKGGLYGNFSSKEEMVMEVFDYITVRNKQHLLSVTAGAATAREKFEALFDHYARYPMSETLGGGCPIINFGAEADDTNPGLKKKVGELIRYYQSRIELLVQLGKDKGEFHPDWDGKKFAVQMFTMLEGAVLVTKVLNSNKQMLVVLDFLRAVVQQHTL